MNNKNMTAAIEADLEKVSGGMIYDLFREADYPPTEIEFPDGKRIMIVIA